MFLTDDGQLLPFDRIEQVDLTRLEQLRVRVLVLDDHDDLRWLDVSDIRAIELLLIIKPSAMESRRLRWKRHAWAVHNLVGHPLMQLLAFVRCYKIALWIHDATVPRPLGRL